MAKSLIVIPARLAATRLPDKPMAEIAGEAMIVHVWRRAIEANCGPVLVATDADSVFDAVAKAGGEAVMTRPDHASGSDRIHEALQQVDPDRRVDTIVNLQGDLPTLDPGLVHTCVAALEEGNADIGTIAAEIVRRNLKILWMAYCTPLGFHREIADLVHAVLYLHGGKDALLALMPVPADNAAR